MIDGSTAAAILALLGVLYVAWRDRNSAGDSLVTDALAILAEHKKRIDELEKTVREQELQIQQLQARETEKDKRIVHLEETMEAAVAHIWALEKRIDALGGNPPQPPEILNDWLDNHKE